MNDVSHTKESCHTYDLLLIYLLFSSLSSKFFDLADSRIPTVKLCWTPNHPLSCFLFPSHQIKSRWWTHLAFFHYLSTVPSRKTSQVPCTNSAGLMYHASSPSILYKSRTTHIFSFVLKANPSDWIFNIVFVVVSLCIFLFVCACACAFALLHSLKSTTVYTHTYFAVSEKCEKCGGKRPH